MRKPIFVGSFVVAVCSAFASASSVSAQNAVRRPALSPYLQLLRPQTTPLPNYQSFVQPRIQAQRDRVQQNQINNRVQRQITSQRQDFGAFVASGIRPTGGSGGGGHMNFSHFYPSTLRRR